MTPYLILSIAAIAVPIDKRDADTLVICPPVFQSALQPWIEYRKMQGYRIVVQSPASTSFGIGEQVRHIAANGQLKNVVLIGDAYDATALPAHLVPTDYIVSKVVFKYGGELEIATDNTYADPDRDGILDLTIGRIPVDTPTELTEYVNRVIEYEDRNSGGAWQRRVNFVAGVGGFGQVADSLIEQSVKRIVTDLIPSQYDTTMTYGNWRSPYCPDPRRFSETAIGRFNEGCLFWVYIGHADRRGLAPIRLPDQQCSILDNRSLTNIRATSGAPIAILLSCYSAAIDDALDGLGERLLKQAGGPVAVISSSQVSMPYAMGIFSLELIDGYFDGQTATLGELVLRSKQRMVQAPHKKSELRELVDSMGLALSREPKLLNEEAAEHVQLMHLLGDPLLKLKRPADLNIQTPATTYPGETITIAGVADQAGSILVDLTYRRDRFRNRPPRRRAYSSSNESFDNYQSVYDQIQDQVSAVATESIPAGPFTIQLTIPADCSGACHVRAMLTGPDSIALGSNEITIEDRVAGSSRTSGQ